MACSDIRPLRPLASEGAGEDVDLRARVEQLERLVAQLLGRR